MAELCPQQFIGQWNGFYYYWGEECQGCTTTTAHDNRPHVIDRVCGNPPAQCKPMGTQHCTDPIKYRVIKNPMGPKPSPFLIGLEHHCSEAVVDQGLRAVPAPHYVPRRGNENFGNSDDPRGRFYSAGVHVGVISDFEVAYEGPTHGKYLARLLIVAMCAPCHCRPIILTCGQELNPRVASAPPLRGTYQPASHGPCHVVEVDGMPGLPFYVVTMPP